MSFDFSIGIITYKRNEQLFSLLNSLGQIQSPCQLVLINNNTEDLREELHGLLPSNITLTYIWEGLNLGISCARNKILLACLSDIVFMLDDDVLLGDVEEFVEQSLCVFRANEEVAALAYKILNPITGRARLEEVPDSRGQGEFKDNCQQEVFRFIGACHALRVGTALRLGAYPDNFTGWGYEDVALAFKIINARLKIIYLPIEVFHLKHSKGRDLREVTIMSHYRNSSLFISSHLRLRYIVLGVLLRGIVICRHTGRLRLAELFKIWQECFNIFTTRRLRFSPYFYDTMHAGGQRVW